jgi:hypothetical protein
MQPRDDNAIAIGSHRFDLSQTNRLENVLAYYLQNIRPHEQRGFGMISEVLIMPFPATWAMALVNDEPADLDDDAWGKCRILIEQLRHDGYVVVAVADNAWPRVTDQFRLHGGDADSGEVLDYVVFGGQPIPPQREPL